EPICSVPRKREQRRFQQARCFSGRRRSLRQRLNRMPEPLRLLSLGKDPTLFEDGVGVQGDARQRHIRYREVMRSLLGTESDIRIVTYTTRRSGNRFDEPTPGLRLYGTASIHRTTYLADCARIIRQILKSGWAPTAITTQTPWEEGGLGALL